MRSIYLDYNATTPLAPAAQEAMLPYLSDQFADPLSDHVSGRAVNEALEDARSLVGQAINARSSEIIWTSGATEACNLALRGLIESKARSATTSGETPHLIVSALDHAAVQGPARYLASIGAELSVVPCNQSGMVSPAAIYDAMRPNTRLVSVVHANEEIGTIQPLKEIGTICHEEGVLLHSDAAQSFGKTAIDVESLGVDLMSLSAHKAYGPKGVGALYVRSGIGLEPMLYGDGQENGWRSGMPNVAGIVGYGAAATVACQSLQQSTSHQREMRDLLAKRLLAGAEEGQIFGIEANERLPNTLCFALPGVSASEVLCSVPELSATPCSGGWGSEVSLSSTMQAIEASASEAAGAIRLSVGWYTNEEEIEQAASALLDAWEKSR